MDKTEIIADLEWILAELGRDGSAFLLEHIVQYKEYAAIEVHEWAREYKGDKVIRRLYNKIKELLHIRILEAVRVEKLDRGIAARHLSAFYEYVDKSDVKVKGDLVVQIAKEGADL